MSNVVDLPVITTLDIDPDRVLTKAVSQLERVMVIGVDKNGDEYFASSAADGGTCLWDLECVKMKLLRIADRD
ncbi:hypothetical protein AB4Y96_09285 [Phyllobacterium sp. TAF24]|uniref:hypothetical protein n=1 Tax=Phyllobacterium sp. TAF24 TaxID=3233068 RepID=UPI003F9D5BA5